MHLRIHAKSRHISPTFSIPGCVLPIRSIIKTGPPPTIRVTRLGSHPGITHLLFPLHQHCSHVSPPIISSMSGSAPLPETAYLTATAFEMPTPEGDVWAVAFTTGYSQFINGAIAVSFTLIFPCKCLPISSVPV